MASWQNFENVGSPGPIVSSEMLTPSAERAVPDHRTIESATAAARAGTRSKLRGACLPLTTADITPADYRMRGFRPTSAVFGLLLFVGASCGSRTQLFMAERCALEGEERPCEGPCGEGIERCENGIIGACVVPRAVEACDNACGSGLRECIDETWGECVVRYAERGCVNDCGVGVEGCTDGRWGDCQVPATMFACSD